MNSHESKKRPKFVWIRFKVGFLNPGPAHSRFSSGAWLVTVSCRIAILFFRGILLSILNLRTFRCVLNIFENMVHLFCSKKVSWGFGALEYFTGRIHGPGENFLSHQKPGLVQQRATANPMDALERRANEDRPLSRDEIEDLRCVHTSSPLVRAPRPIQLVVNVNFVLVYRVFLVLEWVNIFALLLVGFAVFASAKLCHLGWWGRRYFRFTLRCPSNVHMLFTNPPHLLTSWFRNCQLDQWT